MDDDTPTTRQRRRLVTHALPAEPRAAALFLHGGRESGLASPRRWSLPALRMRPFVRSVAAATAAHPVALAEVRYRHSGWNGDRADAALDAWSAVEELLAATDGVPLVLVGHSMGARAALRIGGHPGVSGVVALAPWCPEEEPVDHLAGARLALVHSDRDRITDPRGSLRFAARARAAGAEVCRLVVPGSDHAMLRRAADWHGVAAGLTAGLLGLTGLPEQVAAAMALRADDRSSGLSLVASGVVTA